MLRVSSSYVCQQCGFRNSTFLGRCPECGSWNTLVEEIDSKSVRVSNKAKRVGEIVQIADILKRDYDRIKTSLSEFDRVLGGGVVLGSIVLISGDPGIGKSTLLTQLTINIEGVLYVAGEESAQQIKMRSERINPKANFPVLNETDVDVIIATIEKVKPKLVIVDSIQALETADLASPPGSVGQVRESTHRLQRLAKKTHTPIFLVGHVTKEGTVAGPKTLEHLVDAVLSLEGDPNSNFRLLRGLKNRFGPTDEVGIFEMEDQGMIEVKNPSQFFLESNSRQINAPGSAIVITLNGLRPLLVEIQALVAKSFLPIPRRQGSGVDNNRLQLLIATLSKRLNLPLGDKDIYVNVTGGLKVTEPAVDLAICMAIVSSLQDKTIPPSTAFVGEVGLLGELRSVRQLEKRVSEAKKLGFSSVISPVNTKSLQQAVKLIDAS